MEIITKPYEISLWEDVLTFKYQTGEETEGQIENGHGPVVAQYYKERLLCIIGSDTMDTPVRANQAKLVSKVNGENTLTFNMYSHYYDTETEEFFENPFVGLLVNERKVKLRYGALGAEDTKWYDLVIKNIQENSDNKTFSYTAKNLFTNELSKSGFNLEFHQDLENNMGNIEYLGGEILRESDWRLKNSGEILKQTLEEPLYQVRLNKTVTLKNMEDASSRITLNSGKIVYVFYSSIVNKNSYVQMLYAETYEVDDDNIITNSPNWFLEGVTYNANGIPDFANDMGISDTYRGKRLVRKVKTTYDSTIDKYVNVYKDESGKEIYGYTETEYLSPATVRSYVTNPNSYESYTGWEVGKGSNNEFPGFDLVSVPDVRDVPSAKIMDGSQDFISCLKLNFTDTQQMLYNSGIVDFRHYIDGFVKGEKYIFRVKYGKNSGDSQGKYGAYSLVSTDTDLIFKVSRYDLEDGKYVLKDTPLFTYQFSSSAGSSMGYLTSTPVECQESLTYAQMVEMTNKLGLFIQSKQAGEVYIEDVQFFPYIDSGNGTALLPDEIKSSEVRTMYIYYEPNADYKSLEEVKYVYRGDTQPTAYQETYNDISYEKVRSITASESNRFNLIQELCEIFECWPKFEIEHDPLTGMILLDENYRQKKWVSFHEYIGKDNYAGFKYGINLKSIRRTIDSEGIVSKLIVKNNSNEFGTDGFCSIARATESPNGENFLLDFSYYIQQGMLGLTEITNDLYFDSDNSQGYIGYYKELKRINTIRDTLIKEQSGLLTDIAEYQASLQTYNLSVAEADKQYRDKLVWFKSQTGYTFEELMEDEDNSWRESEEVIAAIAAIGRLKSVIKNHQELADRASENLTTAQNRYDEINRILTSKEESNSEARLLIDKENLHRKFYTKYSRFLQEGSWISEDYVDDNLYYLDAQSTLSTSAKPKITYEISVLELSQLEGYENYIYDLGDKTTIQDTEFFGWVWRDGIQTPYEEEIVVTELAIVLDSPEQNQIKVQNYKTQFEDLFQRMAATTQSVEYSTGKYQKVSGIIETDGTINITTLQNSIANNALTLQNANDQSVVWDETGITTTSISNPAEIVRIVSGGVFLSVDGGITWNTGITGRGINASYITSGQMNVEEVNILNGSFPSFRWDNTGISAYEFQLNENTGEVGTFNFSKFVRLDQYGLYGINGHPNFNSAVKDAEGVIGEDKIWKYANFALTWKGFQIKSNSVQGGYVSITSDNDLQVFSAPNQEQIKIGLLHNGVTVTSRVTGEERQIPLYGIRIKDWEGYVVMEQSSDGKMWIRDELKVGANASSVSIGYLNSTKADTAKFDEVEYSGNNLSEIHQVINAANKFIVHEDGSMVATDGQFTGTIYATGGKIGNMEIESFIDPGYEVSIEVQGNTGTVFDADGENKTLVAYLYKNGQKVMEGITGYQWFKNNSPISGATSKTLIVNENDVEKTAEFSCQITKE